MGAKLQSITAAASLPQNLVTGLPSDLVAKADAAGTTAALATKADAAATTAALATKADAAGTTAAGPGGKAARCRRGKPESEHDSRLGFGPGLEGLGGRAQRGQRQSRCGHRHLTDDPRTTAGRKGEHAGAVGGNRHSAGRNRGGKPEPKRGYQSRGRSREQGE